MCDEITSFGGCSTFLDCVHELIFEGPTRLRGRLVTHICWSVYHLVWQLQATIYTYSELLFAAIYHQAGNMAVYIGQQNAIAHNCYPPYLFINCPIVDTFLFQDFQRLRLCSWCWGSISCILTMEHQRDLYDEQRNSFGMRGTRQLDMAILSLVTWRHL